MKFSIKLVKAKEESKTKSRVKVDVIFTAYKPYVNLINGRKKKEKKKRQIFNI
jgi:hypothetical protein